MPQKVNGCPFGGAITGPAKSCFELFRKTRHKDTQPVLGHYNTSVRILYLVAGKRRKNNIRVYLEKYANENNVKLHLNEVDLLQNWKRMTFRTMATGPKFRIRLRIGSGTT